MNNNSEEQTQWSTFSLVAHTRGQVKHEFDLPCGASHLLNKDIQKVQLKSTRVISSHCSDKSLGFLKFWVGGVQFWYS